MVRRRVVVTGRVQGVFYRASTADQARSLGVAGWVRNCSDGAVEAELEGPTEAVDAVVGWMRTGPAHARVDTVEVTDVAPTGGRDFRVR